MDSSFEAVTKDLTARMLKTVAQRKEIGQLLGLALDHSNPEFVKWEEAFYEWLER